METDVRFCCMTALLEKAMNQINALPPEEQDVVASLILEEIESEKRWGELFAGSQRQLAQLAGEAHRRIQGGKDQTTRS